MDHVASPALSCITLLQNILQDAFHIQAILYAPPYDDFKKIDRGMRAAIWTDYDFRNPADFISEELPGHRIIIIKSNLGFYNIIATFGKGAQPEFITVGPFRDNELSANYFSRILKESHITPSEIQRVKYMYESMPLAQVDSVVNVTKHILESFEPDFCQATPELIQFDGQEHAVSVNNELLDAYSVEYSEYYRELLSLLLHSITTGNYPKAKETLHLFLQETVQTSHKNMRELKMLLHTLNDYCHMALFQTTIHPVHILKQATSLRMKIEEEVSLKKLEQLPNEICHKYYLLVKNYMNPECSRLVKDVISYIQLHLEEELSLNRLADRFNKNPSVLSNAFSKDMGISLTAYIQQTRVQAAVGLFNTTDMTVSEVATAVGYQDFSYFSKIFSRHIGCSPRAYRLGK